MKAVVDEAGAVELSRGLSRTPDLCEHGGQFNGLDAETLQWK